MVENLSIEQRLEEIGIVPVIKLEDTSKAVDLANALVRGGINCAEVTFRAEGADRVIKDIVTAFPDMLVGAGTVLTCEQADRAIASGAKFIVAPGLNVVVANHCIKAGVPFIPGVATASEVEQAMQLGLRAVKFFPAEQAGGINYIKALCAPYQGIRFMPTGGVNENNLNDYLAFDKVFACGGSWMVASDLIKSQNWDEIAARCTTAVNKMLGFEIAHIGINCHNEQQALAMAQLFGLAFGFSVKNGNSSVFAGDGVEVCKSVVGGSNGHIAIKTNSILRALRILKQRGFEAEVESMKYDSAKNPVAVYLKQDFGGFKVHLLQKK